MIQKLFEIDWLKYLTWGVLMISIGFVIKAWGDLPITVYWLEYVFYGVRQRLACFCIPVFLLLASIWVVRQQTTRGIRLWIPGILLLCNILMCSASLPGLVFEHNHQGGIVYKDHVYYVMTAYGRIGIGGETKPNVYWYECDHFGVFCHRIYTYGGWWVDVGEAESWTASLMTDYAAETISLLVNGEKVYTYHPE